MNIFKKIFGPSQEEPKKPAKIIVSVARMCFSDIDYVATARDHYIAQIGHLTKSRIVILPDIKTVKSNHEVIVIDESKTASRLCPIIIKETPGSPEPLVKIDYAGGLHRFEALAGKWAMVG